MIAIRLAQRITVSAMLTVTGFVHATVPASAEPLAQEIRDQTLTEANAVRARFGARPLAWNDALYPAVDEWARNCKFQRSNGEGTYGESRYATSGSTDPGAAIRSAFQMWTSEASKYNYNNPGFSAATGNFTQLVWKSTTALTLAVSRCAAGTIFPMASIFVVVRYTPPGNVVGQFSQNVGRSR